MSHRCCPYPLVRMEDRYGGRILPSSGQCDCDCHERPLADKYKAECDCKKCRAETGMTISPEDTNRGTV